MMYCLMVLSAVKISQRYFLSCSEQLFTDMLPQGQSYRIYLGPDLQHNSSYSR